MATDNTSRNQANGTQSAPVKDKKKNNDDKSDPSKVMEKAKTQTSGGPQTTYDYSKISDVDYYIEFNVYKYERGRQSGTASGRSKVAVFRLPLMSNITMGYSMKYSDADIGLFGDAIISAMKGVGGGGAAEYTKALGQVTGALATQTADFVTQGSEYRAIASNQTGVAQNPRTEATYLGVNMRSHSFAFLLTPKNATEQEMIKKIIKAFKVHQHPNTFKSETIDLADAFLSFPDEWTITFHSRTGPLEIPPIPDSFLQSVTVSYNGNGAPIFYDDGSATSYRIDIAFVEANQLNRNDIETGGF